MSGSLNSSSHIIIIHNSSLSVNFVPLTPIFFNTRKKTLPYIPKDLTIAEINQQ